VIVQKIEGKKGRQTSFSGDSRARRGEPKPRAKGGNNHLSGGRWRGPRIAGWGEWGGEVEEHGSERSEGERGEKKIEKPKKESTI